MTLIFRYAQASAIDESVKDLKSRESGLKELIIEREDALRNNDLIAAQSYQTSKPANISAQLQDSNITVITVNTGTNAQVNTYFGDIASPGMNLTMNQEDVQMALMKANCHCWSNFHQYTVGNKTYGTCVQIESALEKGVYAATACESIKNGYLTTEFSPEKSDFTMNLFTKAYPKTFVYLNGLQLINGTWYWQRPKNEPLLPLDPSSGNLPTNRSPCGVTIQWSDGTV
uniref:C-type lectin domain-containing protein n=1 Tax=Caenorhabditis japonica TaxID=281687 RepID=A0A8R1I2H1_CAEJA